MSKTVAYIRASTIAQDVNNQRHEILEYGHREGIKVDTFVEVTVSSRHSSRQRRIEELQDRLEPGDTLIVTELSRLGRSTGEVILLINQLVAYGVIILIIKQNLRLGEGLQDITAKVMVTLLALFAEIERDFISLRTKEALAAKKAQGVILGKPKGTIQSSMYDKDKERIQELLSLGVPQKRIIESHLEYGTTKSLSYYIRTRNLRKQAEEIN
jgi:DNA invertase Pin-like site-specific DNA recombinase